MRHDDSASYEHVGDLRCVVSGAKTRDTAPSRLDAARVSKANTKAASFIEPGSSWRPITGVLGSFVGDVDVDSDWALAFAFAPSFVPLSHSSFPIPRSLSHPSFPFPSFVYPLTFPCFPFPFPHPLFNLCLFPVSHSGTGDGPATPLLRDPGQQEASDSVRCDAMGS